MTTEEKAKAYDDALEKAKSMIDDLRKGEDILAVSDLESMFPELRESEDERIRKFLVELVSNDKENNYRGLYEDWKIDFDNVLAYLEKQKINTEGDFGRGYDCGYKACLNSHGAEFFEKQKEKKEISMPNSTELIEMWDKEEAMLKEKDFRGDKWRLAYNAFLDGFARGTCVKSEKQKEQKPLEYLPKEKVYDIMSKLTSLSFSSLIPIRSEVYKKIDEITSDVRDLLDYPIEQKPIEWSEDFEENIRNLLHDKLTGHSKDGTMTWTTFIDDKTLRDIVSGIWFYVGKEALKYPNKELNIAEWSEEDKFKLEDAITGIDVGIGFYETEGKHPNLLKAIIEAKEWLKSLRPQLKQECSIEKGIQWLDENFYHDDRSSGRGELHIISTEAFSSMEEMFDSFRKTVSQPHWKPSKEQLLALRTMVVEYPDDKELLSLYEDLTKL